MPTVEGAGVELAYEDEGADPPTTLVVHGMASGAAASAELRSRLPGRVIAHDLLVRRPELLASAVLCDAPLLAFVPEANEALAAERQHLEEALRDGGPQAAIAYWLGPGADPE